MNSPGMPRVAEERDGGADGDERDLEDDEAGGVVDQAFALDDGDDAAREAEPLRNGGGGDGVGRRDDGAEDKADR